MNAKILKKAALPILSAALLPVIAPGCKDKENPDLLVPPVSEVAKPISGYQAWKTAIREEAQPLTLEESRAFGRHISNFIKSGRKEPFKPLTFNSELTAFLVNDLLQTTEAYASRLLNLLPVLTFTPDSSQKFAAADDSFSKYVDTQFRQIKDNPELFKLLNSWFNIKDLNCNEYSLTYLATYIAVAQEQGVDISGVDLQMHTGIYFDPNYPPAANGIGHMWLSINGKIHDPTIRENEILITTSPDGHYFPIVASKIQVDISQSTIEKKLHSFVEIPKVDN